MIVVFPVSRRQTCREPASLLTQNLTKGTLRTMWLLWLLVPMVLLFLAGMYRVYRPRRSLREFMDTTPVDMLRADDGKGYGHLEDPSETSWGTQSWSF
jgi:hypothetical protein